MTDDATHKIRLCGPGFDVEVACSAEPDSIMEAAQDALQALSDAMELIKDAPVSLGDVDPIPDDFKEASGAIARAFNTCNGKFGSGGTWIAYERVGSNMMVSVEFLNDRDYPYRAGYTIQKQNSLFGYNMRRFSNVTDAVQYCVTTALECANKRDGYDC